MNAACLRLAIRPQVELYGTKVPDVLLNLCQIAELVQTRGWLTEHTQAQVDALQCDVGVAANGDALQGIFWSHGNSNRLGEAANHVCQFSLALEVQYALNGEQTERMADLLQKIASRVEAQGLITHGTTANVRELDVEVLTIDTPESRELVLARAVVEGNDVAHADEAIHRLANGLRRN